MTEATETTEQTAKPARGAAAAAGTLGLLLSVGAAFALGWYVSQIYTTRQATKAAAEQAAKQQAMMMGRPVTVETTKAAKRAMNPPQEFMGHVEPIEKTDLRAQIDGTIAEVAFTEGSMVKAGDLLFLIDPRVYEARVAQAKAALEKAKASSENADRYYARISAVDKRSVTEAEIDQAYATMLEARAAIAQCEADLKSAEINLGYTRITAPISGRIGKSLLKKGDYVAPSMGSLARIVQTDPVRVVFSIPDKELLQGRRVIEEHGKVEAIRAQLRLADGSIYEHDGESDFVSNEIDSATATLAIRYRFANPNQFLVSNGYVTVLLSEAEPKEIIAVPTGAVLANATGDYVYLNVNGTAVRRIVKLGETQGGYIAILEGLSEGEEVITEGVVNVSDGAKLNVVNPAVK
ncbi:MAG: efflux RND transporter periplasmic adaptor subunit [Lentisphaeraceae bacterium]|nr:efflux RND transporter periplasmic adaptor subunit [Lentisphaeraceae bacterium]